MRFPINVKISYVQRRISSDRYGEPTYSTIYASDTTDTILARLEETRRRSLSNEGIETETQADFYFTLLYTIREDDLITTADGDQWRVIAVEQNRRYFGPKTFSVCRCVRIRTES